MKRKILILIFLLILFSPLLWIALMFFVVWFAWGPYLDLVDYPIGRDTVCVLGNNDQYQLLRGYDYPDQGTPILDYALVDFTKETPNEWLLTDIRKYKFYWGTLCMVDAEGSYWTFDDKTGELSKVDYDDLSKGLKKTFDRMKQ